MYDVEECKNRFEFNSPDGLATLSFQDNVELSILKF
jgi:hypothetical protein